MRLPLCRFLILALAASQVAATNAPSTNSSATVPSVVSPQRLDELIHDLRVYETRTKAVKPLIEAGTAAVPKLIQAYSSTEDAFVKLTISVIIQAMGVPAADPLIAAWGTGNSDAANLLLMLGKDARTALPMAMRELNRPEADRAVLAAMVLGAIGPDAAPAVPALLRRLQAGEPWLSTQCAEAMAKIGRPGIDPTLDSLIEMVRKRDHAWDDAASVLGSVRDDPQTVVPLIAAALVAEKTDGSAFGVMLGLRNYGQAAGPAIPLMIQYAGRDKADDPSSTLAAESAASTHWAGLATVRWPPCRNCSPTPTTPIPRFVRRRLTP